MSSPKLEKKSEKSMESISRYSEERWYFVAANERFNKGRVENVSDRASPDTLMEAVSHSRFFLDTERRPHPLVHDINCKNALQWYFERQLAVLGRNYRIAKQWGREGLAQIICKSANSSLTQAANVFFNEKTLRGFLTELSFIRVQCTGEPQWTCSHPPTSKKDTESITQT